MLRYCQTFFLILLRISSIINLSIWRKGGWQRMTNFILRRTDNLLLRLQKVYQPDGPPTLARSKMIKQRDRGLFFVN